MLHPSYSELMTKINEEAGEPLVKSRYSIVMSTAKRARQMVDKGYYTLPDHSRKPLSIAVEELYDGDIRILTEEENADYQLRFAEKREAEARARAEAEARRRAEEEVLRQADLKEIEEEEEDEDAPLTEDFDEMLGLLTSEAEPEEEERPEEG